MSVKPPPSEVTLPWPPRILSPNVRAHWAAKNRAAQAYRYACWGSAKEAKLTAPPKPKSSGKRWLHVGIRFYPPDKRRRDDDNMITSLKYGLDGLALALGLDDNCFIIHPSVSESIGGMVKIKITDKLADLEDWYD